MPDALLRLHHDEHDGAGVTAALRAVLGSGTVIAHGGPQHWRQEAMVDDGITIARLEVRGDVEVVVPRSPELIVLTVRRGSVRLQERDRDGRLERGDLGLIPVGGSARLTSADLDLELHAVPAATIGRVLGVPSEDVQLHAPRRADRSERGTDRDLAVLRRAIAVMRLHLREPVSIPEAAAAAGLSVRGLQLVFRRQLGTSPLLHLRRLRLDAARHELLQRAVDGTTVAAVAEEFGYSNPARFSTRYRDAFSESPAAAIRRVHDDAAGPAGGGAHPVPPDAQPRRR